MDGTKKVLLVDGGDMDKKLKLATQNLHYVNVLPLIVSGSLIHASLILDYMYALHVVLLPQSFWSSNLIPSNVL
jgi:hypothetical protein